MTQRFDAEELGLSRQELEILIQLFKDGKLTNSSGFLKEAIMSASQNQARAEYPAISFSRNMFPGFLLMADRHYVVHRSFHRMGGKPDKKGEAALEGIEQMLKSYCHGLRRAVIDGYSAFVYSIDGSEREIVFVSGELSKPGKAIEIASTGVSGIFIEPMGRDIKKAQDRYNTARELCARLAVGGVYLGCYVPDGDDLELRCRGNIVTNPLDVLAKTSDIAYCNLYEKKETTSTP